MKRHQCVVGSNHGFAVCIVRRYHPSPPAESSWLEPVVPVQLATVDVHHFTAHPGGTLGREEEDYVGNLLRLSSPVERLIGVEHLVPAACIAENLLGTLHVDAAPAFGFHGAWVHPNHPDAVVDAAAPERLGKAVQRYVRGIAAHIAPLWTLRSHPHDVDNHLGRPPAHVRVHGAT